MLKGLEGALVVAVVAVAERGTSPTVWLRCMRVNREGVGEVDLGRLFGVPVRGVDGDRETELRTRCEKLS